MNLNCCRINLVLVFCFTLIFCEIVSDKIPPCNQLLVGQYVCDPPVINNDTQEIDGCTVHENATVKCWPLPKINCSGEIDIENKKVYFRKEVPCRYTNGYSYQVAVLLSVFLGWLGADRFYLGYPAIGLLKLCTFGICGIGALVDFMLISLQIVTPSDGSNYVIPYYGPRLTKLNITKDTYYKPAPN